jgi:hypothetical protein
MAQSGHDTLCQWVNENLERYLDGDLPPSEAAMVESHTAQCAACADELKLAQQVTGSLRALPILECPARVTDTVYGQIESLPKKRASVRIGFGRLFSPVFWRPALAGVVAVLLVALIGVVGSRKHKEPTVSARDLARAKVEVKWALGCVNQITKRTSQMVKDELLDPRVIWPVVRAVEKTDQNRGNSRDSQEVRNAG